MELVQAMIEVGEGLAEANPEQYKTIDETLASTEEQDTHHHARSQIPSTTNTEVLQQHGEVYFKCAFFSRTKHPNAGLLFSTCLAI